MPSTKRFIEQALLDLSTSRQVSFTSYSQGWILRLEKAGKVRHVYGYNFDLNSASACLIANDKAGLSTLLAAASLPHVEHRLFIDPSLEGFVASQGNWSAIQEYARGYDYNLVCKTNQGSGGVAVYRIQTPRALEKVFQKGFQIHRGICLSPFYAIENEYRLIMLNNQVLLAYEKISDYVTGDGQHSFEQLVSARYTMGLISSKVLTNTIEDPPVKLNFVPTKGAHIQILWKHNLGRGARAQVLAEEAVVPLQELARKALDAGGLNLAAVDLIRTEGKVRILEVNAGIMLEHFARHTPNGKELSMKVYQTILDELF